MFVLSLWSAIFPPKNGDDSDDSDDKNGPPTKELTSANRAEGKHTGEKGYEPVSADKKSLLLQMALFSYPFVSSFFGAMAANAGSDSGDDSDDKRIINC